MAAQSSRTLVGRDAELGQLCDLLGVRAEGDRSGIVLLSGDAGVGKTRLLMELRDLAQGEGWRVLAGHCLDFGESALPYLPFSEVLGRLTTELPDLVDGVGRRHRALARLQPGHRMLTAADAEAEPAATERADLFEAVHHTLELAAADDPLLVVVEDLHWADQSTRELLGYLFTRTWGSRVAIVASYRSDDLHRRHPLRRQVAEWSRVPEVDRLALSPLPDADVQALIAELAPHGLGDQERADIVRRAEGNAFFVEELVASGGGWVPDDLADLLLVRLDRLSDEARQVVRIASVAGRKVTHQLLEAVAGLPPADLDVGIRQAVEMNVLVAGTKTYSFRHALLGEAVYDDLLPGERVRLHGQYVAALTAGSARGTAAELARHARRAMDFDRAAAASLEAGDEATSVGGPSEAARHYEHALELLTDHERVSRLGVNLAKVVVKAADAIADAGDAQRAVQLLADHLDRLQPDAPAGWRPTLLEFYAELLAYIETDLDPVEISREAVDLVPEDGGALRVRVLATHARMLAAAKRTDEARATATEGLALAERLDLPKLASELMTTLGGLRTGAESDLRGALEEAVRKAQATGALGAELRGRWLLARSYQDCAEWEEAERWFRSLMDPGSESGRMWAPYVLDARLQLGSLLHARGRWDEALELLSVADDSAPPMPRALIEPFRLAILAGRGTDVHDALRDLRKVWPDDGLVPVNSAGIEIEVLGRRGDAEGAIAAYDDAVGVLSRIWHPHFAARVRLAALTLAAIARSLPDTPAAQRTALVERADGLLEDGATVIERYQGQSGQWEIEGRAWALRLDAEHLRVRWLAGVDEPDRQQLLDAWEAALAGFVELGHVPELAQLRASYSGILRALGDTTAARQQGDLARDAAHQLGATVILDELRAVGGAPARTEQASPQRLTAREREILALVAEGRSNGEIGRRLFISTKTVSVHVSNILGKLGAAGRTEAAAIARRDRLLD